MRRDHNTHGQRKAQPSDDNRRGTRRRLFLEPLEARIVLSGVPELVDLDPSSLSSPSDFTVVGTTTYFVANDLDHGRELWKTDGTAAGTSLVRDIRDGSSSANISELVDFNGTLFFVADDGISGQELWTSDGTTAGTVLVHDINPGSGYQYPYGDSPLNSHASHLTVVGDKLFFGAEDASAGAELWVTDGTSAGTMMVRDINTGTHTDANGTYPNSSDVRDLVNVNGTLFFTADDGVNRRELWLSDGSSAGTVLVKDIAPGSYSNNNVDYPYSGEPALLTALDGTLFFVARDDAHGLELWSSDGTTDGTLLVEDIRQGTADAFTVESHLAAIGGTLFFTADDGLTGDELWTSDGTSAGTTLVKDIQPGSDGDMSYYPGFIAFNGELFFSAYDGATGASSGSRMVPLREQCWSKTSTPAWILTVATIIRSPIT